ncbi:MAG: signal peptidase I [Candidatus Brocadiae bacterium]|nr:signal peptidase I [Candidatus Brocadiia bacterium]
MAIETTKKLSVRKTVDYIKFFIALALIYIGFMVWQSRDMIIIPLDHHQMSPSFSPKKFHTGLRLETWGKLQYGDVVYYDYPFKPDQDRREILFFARVVGLPGDRIALKNGKVYRNGKALEENYVQDSAAGKDNISEIIIPRDYCYLLVDNRNNYTRELYFRDSRSLGPILIHTLEGKIGKTRTK